MIGLRVNQTVNVTVDPSNAYGSVNPSLIISVPIAAFGNSIPTVGLRVTTSNGQAAIIQSVNATNAIVDFNNPLAGKTLHFEIRVVAIQK